MSEEYTYADHLGFPFKVSESQHNFMQAVKKKYAQELDEYILDYANKSQQSEENIKGVKLKGAFCIDD